MKMFLINSVAAAAICVSTGAFAGNAHVPLPPSRAIVLAQSSGTNGGAVSGATAGAVGGAIVGGPVGAVVGGAAGYVGGAAVGSLTNEDRTYVRQYSTEHRYPSVKYEREVVVGEELPGTATYYEIQGRPAMSSYRYTRVNDHTVLVDPRTHKIIEVID